MSVIHKTLEFSNLTLKRGSSDVFTCTCSTENEDRHGDRVVQRGINWRAYLMNSIVLYNHEHKDILGTAENLRIENNELRADIRLAPEGTSPLVDTVRKLIAAGILKAISIGFFGIKGEAIIKDGYRTGTRWLETELCEISIVAVGSNREAVAIAKSLKIPDAMIQKILKTSSEDSIGDKIRRARQVVKMAREELARTTNPNSRMTLLKKIAQLEKMDAEHMAASRGEDSKARLARETRESLARLTKTIEPRLAAVRMQISELWERYSIAVLKQKLDLQLKLQREIEALEKREAMFERLIGKPKPAPKPAPSMGRWADAQAQDRKNAEARFAKQGAQNEAAWKQSEDDAVREMFETYREEELKRRK